jgi:hypothetical protein
VSGCYEHRLLAETETPPAGCAEVSALRKVGFPSMQWREPLASLAGNFIG